MNAHACVFMHVHTHTCACPSALQDIWDGIKALCNAQVPHFWLALGPLNVLGLIQGKRVFENHISEGKKPKHPSFGYLDGIFL